MNLKNLFNKDAWDTRITGLFKDFYIKNFTKTYYYQGRKSWQNTTWLGTQLLKAPTDLWVYQEMIYKFQPDYIIECGTFQGGSAFYFASIFDLIGKGEVITVDINPCDVEHKRITKIVDKKGSAHPEIIQRVKDLVKDGKCLVILDSTHRKQHVLDEMDAYADLVPKDWYMVVEDTCLGGNPVLPSWGDGPMDAVHEFIKKRDDFIIDKSMEKFFLTLHPNGFLKRIK